MTDTENSNSIKKTKRHIKPQHIAATHEPPPISTTTTDTPAAPSAASAASSPIDLTSPTLTTNKKHIQYSPVDLTISPAISSSINSSPPPTAVATVGDWKSKPSKSKSRSRSNGKRKREVEIDIMTVTAEEEEVVQPNERKEAVTEVEIKENESDEEGEEDELYDPDEEEESEGEERKESDNRKRAISKSKSSTNDSLNKPSTTTDPSSAPPLIPFIFQPQAAPTESELKESDRVIQERLAQFLNGVELIDVTTPQQRAKMSKDRLLQRNIEIQSMMFHFDRDYDSLLTTKPAGWELAIQLLDDKNDSLAEESDEIETLLFEKFRVVGGGRSLLSDEIIQAGEFGAHMADGHRQRGLPIPTLSLSRNQSEASPASTSAASSSTTSSTAAAAAKSKPPSSLAALLPSSTSDDVEMAIDEQSTDGIEYPPTSRSDAAMFQRLDAAQEATRIRRAQRKEQQKEGLLGKYLQYFEQFIDVNRDTKKSPTSSPSKRAKKVSRPENFSLYLGTVVFPLFTHEHDIRAPQTPEATANSSEDAPIKIESSEHHPAAASLAPTTASSSAPNGTPTRKRPRSSITEEDAPAKDHIALSDSLSDDEDEEAEEEEVGEDVWLDFTYDPEYQDGCLVKQVRPTSTASGESDDDTETVTIGLLPLTGLHPPAEEEPEPEFDENGEELPRRPRAKPMPDPSHALAALYILHEGGIIRLESTLVRASAEPSSTTDSGSTASLDHIEVTILVNSRIYDTYLLRSIAQKEALRTLFRLFTLSDPTATPAPTRTLPATKSEVPLYPNDAGELVPYSSLTDSERRRVAFTDVNMSSTQVTPLVTIKVKQSVVDDGVAPMEMDSDNEEEKTEMLTPSISVKSEPEPFASTIDTVYHKRRKVEPMQLSALDQLIAGDEIGSSEDEDEDDDEEDEGEDMNSEDELCETLVDDHHIFVDLVLPQAASKDQMKVESEPSVSPSATGAVEDASDPSGPQVTEEEIASYKAIEKKSAELDRKSGDASPTLTLEEKELEDESRQKWKPDTLHTLFESIRPTPAWTKAAAQPVDLISTLRPFQQKALAWMMERENVMRDEEYEDPLWMKAVLNGRHIYYQPFQGLLQKEKPAVIKDVCGGILADEMGLGKTVVVIALVLKSPFQPESLSPRHEIMIQREGESVRLPKVGATLIVSPMSLVYQWLKEIKIHAPSLKVLVYDGTKPLKTNEEATKLYEATMSEFAAADIILTNYAVLGAEVNYSKECQYKFRGAKQYAIPKSPLLDCHFHRVILDEAQMVHSSLSVCFKMAARIVGTSRFCVSGTPIGPQGLHDLYGLVSFLGHSIDAGSWRSSMRCSKPDGMERLRQLLKRIMWRHSKAHVLDEVCIPPLHLNKILLNFSKVESENYKALELECRSKVFFEGAKNHLEDRTAMKKLESLRQACAHPGLAGALGKEIKSIPDIGKMLVQRVTDAAASSERDLCRATNKLALEYRRQGQLQLAEQAFITSWKIADAGLSAADQKEKATAATSSALKRTASESLAASATAAETSSKTLDTFESDVNIVTANTQVRQWRLIELTTCFQLASIYREQLKRQFQQDLPPLDSWRETGAQVFDRVLNAAKKLVPALADASSSTKRVGDEARHQIEKASMALPPQLLAAASSSSGLAASSSSSSSSDSSPQAALLKKYEQQKSQYEFTLHDLFDLIEENLQKTAVLIEVDYDADLLPKYIQSSRQEVVDLWHDRNRVGVEEFNRATQPYMNRIKDLIPMLEADKQENECILTLYELSRSLALVHELIDKLQNKSRRKAHDAMMTELKKVLKEKFASQPFYAQPPRKSLVKKDTKPRAQRQIEESLNFQSSQLRGAITRREKSLPAPLRARIQAEDDMKYLDLQAECQYYQQYDNAWHCARDSIQALAIMIEVRKQRSKMRIYIKKMIQLRTRLLRDHGIISFSDANQLIQQVQNEVYLEDEDADGDQPQNDTSANPSAKKKAKKSNKPRFEEEEEKVEDEAANRPGPVDYDPSQDEMKDDPSAASSSSASAFRSFNSNSFASRSFIDTDTAISQDVMQETTVNRLKAEIAQLQNQAKAAHVNVTWLKNQFGLLTDSGAVADVCGRVCVICHNQIHQPALTVCGHYTDYSCLTKWLKQQKQKHEIPSCPTCRRALTEDDYATFAAEELPTKLRVDANDQETAAESDQMETDILSTDVIPASAAAASSTSAHPLPSSTSSSSSTQPTLADVQRLSIVGEGHHGSKVETIVKYIKYLHQRNPRVKVLVFSQYHRMLDLVGTALKQNSLNYLHLSGTPKQRATLIDRFHADESCTAFLMSLRTDNSGLTLVNASAVFLMEPSLNPSIEAQAINRIHRIGQLKETHVFKFIMKHSVEEAIDQLTTHNHLSNNHTLGASTGTPLLQTGGAALTGQSKESLSVSQLLTVLNLSDDDQRNQSTDADTNQD